VSRFEGLVGGLCSTAVMVDSSLGPHGCTTSLEAERKSRCQLAKELSRSENMFLEMAKMIEICCSLIDNDEILALTPNKSCTSCSEWPQWFRCLIFSSIRTKLGT
jgi:hypothetical protein